MKTFLGRLLRVAFYGALALVAVWWFALEGASPQQLFFASPAPIPFPDALLRLVSIDVDQRPLDDVLKELSVRHGVSIQLDPAVLQNIVLTGKELVTLKIDGVPLYGVLSLLASNIATKSLSPIVRVKDGVAYVTAENVWYSTPSNYETRVYPLDGLLTAPSPFHESSLGSAITSTIERESWADNANGALGAWEPVPGALVVVQTPDVHDQIQRLLDYLSRQAHGEIDFNPVDISDPCHAANGILRNKLRQRINVEFRKMPLADVLTELSKNYALPLFINPDVVKARNIMQSQLTFRLNNISLSSVLNLICADLDLSLSIHEGALSIADKPLPRSLPFWPRKTIAIPILDLESLSAFDLAATPQWLSPSDDDRVEIWDGHLVVNGSVNSLQQIERRLSAIREVELPYAIEAHSTNSPDQAASKEGMHKSKTWGGAESVRSLAARLADELGANVWVDAHEFRREEHLDVDQVREWPEAIATVNDYFGRNDVVSRFAAINTEGTMVLTTPDRAASQRMFTVHAMGQWISQETDADKQWDEIWHALSDPEPPHRYHFQDAVAVDYQKGANNARVVGAMSELSRTRWPPRGVLYSWDDPARATALCAFDMGPVLNGLQSIAARRIANSSAWPFGAALFADASHPLNLVTSVPLQGKTEVADHLASALDAVISLTLPTHSNGVIFTLLDDTAIAVIGTNDPPRITSMLDTFARQLQQPVRGVKAVRIDIWNNDRRPDNTAAFLYDVRALLAQNPSIDERGLQWLIELVTPPSIVKKYQYDAADVEVLPGFLVVIHDLETQRSLAKLFQYVHSDPVGQVIQNSGLSPLYLDLAPSIFVTHPDWLAKVIDDLRTDDDSVCNNFRAWLLGQAHLNSPEAIAVSIAALMDYLDRTISANDAHGCYVAASALVHRNSDLDRVLPLLRKAIVRPWESESRASLTELLLKFGRRAIPLLVELLETKDLLVQDTARRSLAEFGADAVPDVLEWFDRTGQKEAHLALDAVDPRLATTRNTLLEWEQSGVPELKARTVRLRKLLEEHGFEL